MEPETQPYLVVLDVDSTLIENEVIELLADKAGSLEEVAAITDRAMRGEMDFAESLRQRVKTLEGLPVSVFTEVQSSIRVTQGVPELIARIKEAQGFVGVVSGGFHEILDPIARALDLDFWKANRLEVVNGRLTGHLLGEIVDAEAKAQTLREWAEETGTPMTHTVAIGDGANDLQMMAIAGIAIAFDAKPIVRERADHAIDGRDMRPILDILSL